MVQNQQKSASLGVRYWPWYVFSGWWVCAKAQYCDYAETGIWRPEYDSGKAVGGGLSAGYTLLISKNFNIEFGAGFWGGKLLEHTLANCPDPDCMDKPRESGPKNFIALNDLNISLHWVFYRFYVFCLCLRFCGLSLTVRASWHTCQGSDGGACDFDFG